MKKYLQFLTFIGMGFAMEESQFVVSMPQTINKKPLISMDDQKQQEVQQFAESLENLADRYAQTGTQKILGSTRGHDVVVVLGSTGVGKSTILNVLAGKQLRADCTEGYVLKDQQNQTFPIGLGSESETSLPQIQKIRGTLCVDLPGLRDNRGSDVAFFNAVCIKDTLLNARSVRFLLVTEESAMVSERAKNFQEFLNQVADIFPDPTTYTSSSLWVVTKTHRVQAHELWNLIEKKASEHTVNSLDSFWQFSRDPKSLIPFRDALHFTDNQQELADYTQGLQKTLWERLDGLKSQALIHDKFCIQSLLVPGDNDLILGLFKVTFDRTWKSLYSNFQNLNDLSDSELRSLSLLVTDTQNQVPITMKNLKYYQFLEIFDPSIYQTYIQQFSAKLLSCGEVLKTKIDDVQHKRSVQQQLRNSQSQIHRLRSEISSLSSKKHRLCEIF